MAKPKYKLIAITTVIIAAVCISITIKQVGSITVSGQVFSENDPMTFIIDAGHGGEDGGATSCAGILESQINLEISKRVNDLLNLLGFNTKMIRTTDISIYSSGTSLSQKKVSDLKERVRIVNETESGILISIHQNQYSDSRYYGAQVFYAPTSGSKQLAQNIQNTFLDTINSGSNRNIKKADGIYLMQHIACPGILIECGFLSNPQEEALLRDPEYQQKISSVIATTLSRCINENLIT